MLRIALLFVMACGRIGFREVGTTSGDAPPRDSRPSANIVFVTSTTQLPTTFGSDLASADAICAARASAAGLPGAYVAWLSTSTVNASDRLGSARGWVRPDGSPFVDTVAELVAGTTYYPPLLDENGSATSAQFVNTGTNAGGASMNCTDYTDAGGTIRCGHPYDTLDSWESENACACNQSAPIYCFGVSLSEPVTITPVAGRRAFVSVQTFTPGGGITAADAVCASDAQSNGLTGTFKALLATSVASPSSRFSAGSNWVRLDGLAIADTAAAFMNDDWATVLNVSSAAAYVCSYTFTGIPYNAGLTTTEATDVTCTDWTTTTGSTYWGRSCEIQTGNLDYTTGTCDTALSLYCLED